VKWVRRITFLCSCFAVLLLVVASQQSIFITWSREVIVLNQSAVSIQGVKQSFGFVHSYNGHYLPELNPRLRYSLHPSDGSLFVLPDLVLSPESPFDRSYRWYVTIPHWLTNLVTWSLFFILWRKSRKHPEGHCQGCGYDLTANTSGRCPECNVETMP